MVAAAHCPKADSTSESFEGCGQVGPFGAPAEQLDLADRRISPFEPEGYSENLERALESNQEDGADMPARLINDRADETEMKYGTIGGKAWQG